MSNAYNYITIDANYSAPGIVRRGSVSEYISACFNHDDASTLKAAVKKYIGYAFKKDVKMTFDIAAGYMEVYTPQARLYHIEIDLDALSTETIAVYTCDRFGSCSDSTKTVYGRRAACRFLVKVLDELKAACDAGVLYKAQ